MTEQEYLETACNAFAMGLRKMPVDWLIMPGANRQTYSKSIHDELASSKVTGEVAFRKQNPRLFRTVKSVPAARKLGTPMPRPSIRNLIYHVCPLKSNDGWLDNIKQLRQRIGVFNGKKVVGISRGDGLHAPEVAMRELPECEFIVLPNCPVLREVVTFLPLLLSVASENYREATFYGHTKSNSTAEDQRGAWAWAKMMYNQLLDFPEEVLTDLETHDAVGTTQMIWHGGPPPFPSGLTHAGWCFCGTFFWFRHDSVFSRPNWMNFPLDRYSAEAWLGGILSPERCKSRFQPWPIAQYPGPSPYQESLYPVLPDG